MTHHFEVEDAQKYGIPKAILLYNLRFWLQKNRANRKHLHDGLVWTYNSAAAFSELFPYMNAGSIKNWLLELEFKDMVIKSGNYNEDKFNRTKWYTIPSEFECETIDPQLDKMQSIAPTMQCVAPTVPPIAPTVQSLYGTDINTDNKHTYKKQGESGKIDENFLEAMPNSILGELTSTWIRCHPQYKKMADPAQDLPALRKIGEKLMKTPHFHATPTETIKKFKYFCQVVLSHEFWQKKSLKSISNNIQEFLPLVTAIEEGRSLDAAKNEKPKIELPPQKINLSNKPQYKINGGAVIKL